MDSEVCYCWLRSGRLFRVARASSPPLPSPAWQPWSFFEENQRLHGYRQVFLFPPSGRLSVFARPQVKFSPFSIPFQLFLLSFSSHVLYCGSSCVFLFSFVWCSSFPSFFPPVSPRFPLLAVRALKRGSGRYGMQGVWDSSKGRVFLGVLSDFSCFLRVLS